MRIYSCKNASFRLEARGPNLLLSFSILLIFLIFGTLPVLAQNSVTTNQLLGAKTELAGSAIMQNNLRFLKESPQGMPIIEEMELRTETNELDASRQEFMFRMSFNNKEMRTVQDRLNQNNIRLYELRTEIQKEAILEDRYELIIDWYYDERALNFLQEKKIILQDKKTVYQKMLANAVVLDIEDLLKVDEDLLELERDIFKANLQKQNAIEQLFASPDMELTLDSANWISIATIQTILDSIKTMPINTLAMELQRIELGFDELEFEKEVAESKQALDFVQLKYAGRNNLEFQKEFSLGIGVTIPTKSSARIQINEAQLDVFDEQYKQELWRANYEEGIKRDYIDFYTLVKEYELLQQQIEENPSKKIYEKYSSTGVVHPLTLLRMKESFLKNKRELQKIEEEICLVFLELIAAKGLLLQTPSVNYLSDNLLSF